MNGRYDEIASAVPADLDALPRLRGFRLRGMEMTRLETFIDAAFAFAISMLVIAANQVPDNIEELLGAFRHVPAFVASIVVLGIFWRGHWTWSRRYGLEDGVSIFISWAMLATILIYIYPLRAVFGSMWFLLSDGRVGQNFSRLFYLIRLCLGSLARRQLRYGLNNGSVSDSENKVAQRGHPS